MPNKSPRRITVEQQRERRDRTVRIARTLGFVGGIEYRHAYSQSGGAQYLQGRLASEDVLVIYAEAFERDANPDDFSLDAMIAHERGHQLLIRHPRIGRLVAGRISEASEEILASILGAIISTEANDQIDLIAKATFELLQHGQTDKVAATTVDQLRVLLEAIL